MIVVNDLIHPTTILFYRYYSKARKVLQQYQHMASFQGIQNDCNIIVQQLIVKLKHQFRDKEVGNKNNVVICCISGWLVRVDTLIQ